MVVISGEAGIGKSRLAAEVARHAEISGDQVLIGACSALGEGAMPYAPVLEALHRARGRSRLGLLDLLAAPANAAAIGRRPDPMGQARIFATILDTLERATRRRATLLLLEDLHWARESTLELIAYLARNLPHRLLPVLTVRTEGLSPRLEWLLAELARLPGADRIDLRPLDETDMAALLAGILEAPPNPRLAEEIHARSGGNPFLAEELMAAVARGDAQAVPARLQGILLARVGDLSAAEIAVIRSAAVLGRSADRTRLRLVARIPTHAVRAALAELEQRALLAADTGPSRAWRFRHDLMREAVYLGTPDSERRAMHAAAARTLAAAKPSTDLRGRDAEVAEHWQKAGRPEMAVPFQARAGDAALALFAFEEAAGWYGRAIEGSEARASGPDAVRALVALLARHAEALAMSGDSIGAEASGSRATHMLEQVGAGADVFLLQARRAHWLWLNHQETAAIRIWDALRAVPVTPEMLASPPVLAVLARLTHLDESATYAADAVASARSAGMPAVEADALIWLGMSLVQTDRVEEGIAALRRAATLAATERNIELYRYGSHLLVAVLGEAERWDEAVEAGEEQLRVLEQFRLEPRQREPIVMNYREALSWMGRWDQLLPEVERALSVDLDEGARCELLLLRSRIASARGNAARAAADLDEATRLGRGKIQESHVGAISILRGELALAEGRLDSAADTVRDGLDAVEATGDLREGMFHDLVLLGMRIEVARSLRRSLHNAGGGRRSPRADAAALLQRLRRRSAQRSPRYTLFSGQIATTFAQARAEARRLSGRSRPELWSRAADGWDRMHRPAAEAYARLRLGEALSLVGDEPGATEALAGARRIAVALGARPLSDEAEAIARAAGLTADALVGVAGGDGYGLTPREREVLGLLTAGWSNKEIGSELGISQKTAEIHVSNVLRKLGVERRVEAATLAVQRGLVASSQAGPAARVELLRDALL
jgi:DNA-binding CsgD family transcriptional regulator/tetratricopeptide (TPR) repeat protein